MSGYIGRFAPSPTGLLHFGSLVAAIASYLDAHANNGLWLVRIEDIDPPREMPGAADEILRTLEAFSLHWDGAVLYQSQRYARYESALDQLLSQKQAYPCQCSRTQVKQRTELLYDGYCRAYPPDSPKDCALRIHMPDAPFTFDDGILGQQHVALGLCGDAVIKRKDGLYAYQLAVVCDDADQGVTHIVRGSDLLDSTPWQYQLQRNLGMPHPHWSHIPVILSETGQKLSKQNLAPALDAHSSARLLSQAIRCLGQPLPATLANAPVQEQLSWAVAHWQRKAVPALMSLPPVDTNNY
ncbi:tRNA glutamyl-Q(34) synthetase GluQRS [Pokkaliibacter sp. CJK22405]|uniref:tRNA glutamyl-Q(34) synthetase GluQRS n=1 Tax=Pokkaliibacter sp. CJK22405 TaxID=3384615 RepID=UPI003984B45A